MGPEGSLTVRVVAKRVRRAGEGDVRPGELISDCHFLKIVGYDEETRSAHGIGVLGHDLLESRYPGSLFFSPSR